MRKLIEFREKLILVVIVLSLVMVAVQASIWGGWPFHLPEIEGGVEVTLENMKHDEEREEKRREEEWRKRREAEERVSEKYLREQDEIERQRKIRDYCLEQGALSL